MYFEFSTSNRIVFGPGSLKTLEPVMADLGSRVMVVTGRSSKRVYPLVRLLEKSNKVASCFKVEEEPTVAVLETGLSLARKDETDFVVGFGGGSAIDTAKAIAALMHQTGQVVDYLEVIGSGKPLTHRPIPMIAVPTTAGTGAEVTCNAVLKSEEHRVKVSLRNPMMFPRLAVVDPELTLSLPPSVTATTGMDALTQLIEAYTSRRSNPMTECICREGIIRSAQSLKVAYHKPENLSARVDLSLASLFSGMALANSGLGAVHGIAAPLGGMCPAPHGAVCAKLLPAVITANVTSLQAQKPTSSVLAKYDKMAQWLTGSPSARSNELTQWLHELSRNLNIPSLTEFGVERVQIKDLVSRSLKASSMKTNPVLLTENELYVIIEKSLG
jgi:alcohol dehydrogenase class IV